MSKHKNPKQPMVPGAVGGFSPASRPTRRKTPLTKRTARPKVSDGEIYARMEELMFALNPTESLRLAESLLAHGCSFQRDTDTSIGVGVAYMSDCLRYLIEGEKSEAIRTLTEALRWISVTVPNTQPSPSA